MRIRLAVLVVGIVVLAGCGVPTPVPTGSPSPSGPAPLTVEAPELRLPLTCDEIVAPATMSAFAGVEVPILQETDRVPGGWYEVMARQVGAVNCAWGPTRDGQVLSVAIVPDGADDFADHLGSIYPTAYERFDAVGDRSVHSCAYGQCSFDILIGDFWVDGFANRPDLTDELDLEPVFLPVLAEIAASVEAAIPQGRPAWSAPDGVLPGWGLFCPDDGVIAEIGEALGRPGLVPTGTDWEGTAITALRLGQPSWCTLYDGADPDWFTTVVVIEGGAWAADLWSTSPPELWGGGTVVPVEVDAVGTVFLLPGSPGHYDAMFALDGSLVSFGVTAGSEEEFVAAVADVVELLRARAAA